nr:hypothetical protein [Tanacetum cinerariifolium]
MRLNFAGNPMSLLLAMLLQAQAGGDFHTSPPRSSHTPPAGQPSGGVEDPITLMALSSIVSTLVQKVHSLEAELHDHKRLFKDVVGKLVKKVKSLEVKLKTKKRRMVLSDSDEEDETTANVDLDASSSIALGASSVAPGASSVAPSTSGVAPGGSITPTVVSAVSADSPKVEANASLSKTLLGDDVFEDNFPARMAALIKKKRQALAEQLFKERQNWPLTLNKRPTCDNEQLLQEFKKIRKVQTQSQLQAFSKTLKRPGSVLEEPPSKKPKSPEAPTPSMPEIPIPPAVVSPPFSRDINALYRIDGTTKHFTTLRQILHLVDRQDLMRLYGLVVQYYEHHPVVGSGLLFWGDLQVLFDSQEGGMGSYVWNNQNVSYPLSVKLIKKMLLHKLEIDSDFVRNDLTTAE